MDIPFFKDEIVINANLIETATGSLLWMERESGQVVLRETRKSTFGRSQEDYLMDPFMRFQEDEMSQNPAETSGLRTLSPIELENVEQVVYNICRSLPKVKVDMPATMKTTVPQRTTRSRTPSYNYDW